MRIWKVQVGVAAFGVADLGFAVFHNVPTWDLLLCSGGALFAVVAAVLEWAMDL